ncbi:GNAT family N-acetyltransferase [Oceanospirillum sp. HFRX-1_2]
MDDYKPAIRSATLDDALAIHHLTKHLGYEPSELSDTKYLLKTLLESDRDDVYVALQDTSVIGWIHCFQTLRLGSEGFYEIGGLVVCSTQRRKGIGKALVDYAITQYPGKW